MRDIQDEWKYRMPEEALTKFGRYLGGLFYFKGKYLSQSIIYSEQPWRIHEIYEKPNESWLINHHIIYHINAISQVVHQWFVWSCQKKRRKKIYEECSFVQRSERSLLLDCDGPCINCKVHASLNIRISDKISHTKSWYSLCHQLASLWIKGWQGDRPKYR